MKMTKDEWIGWLKCNLLEIAILILVLVLVVKAFSAPTAGVSEVTVPAVVEEPAAPEAPEEVSVEGAPAAEVPLEEMPTGEVPVEETLQE